MNDVAQQNLLVLQYLAAEADTPDSGDALLFEILHFHWLAIPQTDIIRLSMELAKRQYGEKKTSLRRLLYEKVNAPPVDLFSVPAPEGMGHLIRLLEKWSGEESLLRKELVQKDLESIFRPAATESFRQQEVAASLYAAPRIAPADPLLEKALLDKFALSATALSNYLRCPLEFYYKNLVRIPSSQNEAMEFGSAIHYALEQLFRKMSEGLDRRRLLPPQEVLIQDFETYMREHRAGFTTAQYERRLAYGREVLGHYYDQYLHEASTVVAIERMLRVDYQGVPLKGKPDKLEFDGRLVNIVDYKTGDADKAMARMQPPDEAHPHGGDYWRQAVFYKILVDHYAQKGWKAVSMEFDFIEPDSNHRYRRTKLDITAPDITTVSQQIIQTWQHIQNRDFYTGCGKSGCHWCGFVKNHGLTINELQAAEKQI